MSETRFDSQRFGLNQLPNSPHGSEARVPEPDCCTKPVCPQRDYNRAMILTLLRLSQAYAGMLLLHWHTTQVWPCEAETGHTQGCPDPSCTFGLDQARAVYGVTDHLTTVIRDVYRLLGTPACDLGAYWMDLHDAEQGKFAMRDVQGSDAQVAAIVRDVLDLWQGIVVDNDDEQYMRWFTPPSEVP